MAMVNPLWEKQLLYLATMIKTLCTKGKTNLIRWSRGASYQQQNNNNTTFWLISFLLFFTPCF